MPGASTGRPAWVRSGTILRSGAFAALVVIGLTAGFLWRERRMAEAREVESVELYARVLLDHAERTFDTIGVVLGSLAESIGPDIDRDALSVLGAELTQAQSGLPFLRSLSVVDGEGWVLASSSMRDVGVRLDLARVPLPRPGELDRLGSSVGGRDLADAAAGGASTAAAVTRSFLPLARVVGSSRGRRFLVAVINPDYFTNEYDLMLADPTRGAGLFGFDATAIAATDNLHLAPGDRIAASRFFTRFLPALESGSFVGPGVDGRAVFSAFRTLRKRPLVVIVERDRAQLGTELARTLAGAIGLGGSALAIVGFMTVFAWRGLRGRERVHLALAASRAEREAARDALESQLAFTAQLLEVSPTPLFVKDLEGRFVTVNRAWLALTGFEPAQVLGRTSSDLFFGGGSAAEHRDAEALTSEERITFETRLLIAGREPRDTLVSKVRFASAGGLAAGIVGSVVDVTQFRSAERRIREALDAAERANGAKSAFIANISHELRTPLQGIIGFSELGRDLSADRPDVLDMFADIHAGGQRMLTLVNGLLDVSQMDSALGSLPLLRHDIALLVREATGPLRPMAALRRQQLRLEGIDRCCPADVDPVRFQQALRSVLVNAIRFAPTDSAIVVSIEQGAHGGPLSIDVRDAGPGIPPDELESIFEAFVQSSRTRDGAGGAGLGLTIARKIMGAHGGSVTAANAAGGGAVVRLTLPGLGRPSKGNG